MSCQTTLTGIKICINLKTFFQETVLRHLQDLGNIKEQRHKRPLGREASCGKFFEEDLLCMCIRWRC